MNIEALNRTRKKLFSKIQKHKLTFLRTLSGMQECNGNFGGTVEGVEAGEDQEPRGQKTSRRGRE